MFKVYQEFPQQTNVVSAALSFRRDSWVKDTEYVNRCHGTVRCVRFQLKEKIETDCWVTSDIKLKEAQKKHCPLSRVP